MRTNTLARLFVSLGLFAMIALASAAPFMANAAATLYQPPANAQGGSSGGNSIGCSNLGNGDLNGVVRCVVSVFNTLIYLMIAGSVVYIIYGAFLMITNEEKREDAKKTIYHGIIGLFVMISIWGFVNILVNTFGLSGVKSSDVLPNKNFIEPF